MSTRRTPRRPASRASTAAIAAIAASLLASVSAGATADVPDVPVDRAPHRCERCGTPPANALRDFAGPPRAAAVAGLQRIVCRFHVIRRSDGSGGIDEARIGDLLRDLNVGFRDTPFRFVREPGTTYIDDDGYYADFPTFQSMIPIWNAYYEPGVLNWFLTPVVQSGQFDATTSFGPPAHSGERGIFMAYRATGSPTNIVTPPHEVGHVFDLNHPGETFFAAECTSGANCAVAGDFICDTPASPNVFGANTTATGIYFANEPGPCPGDPPYDPNTRLYMEFGWPAGHVLRDRFTPGQVAYMLDALVTFQDDLIGPERPDVLVDCDGDGIDDPAAIRSGLVPDVNRDLVPDGCQTFPAPGDLLVCGMHGDRSNRPRYYDGATGAFRDAIWNGYTWAHQLRLGPDGLVYMPRLTLVARLDLETGRTRDNFIDDVLEGAGVLVDVAFAPDGSVLTLDNVDGRIRRHDPDTGAYTGDLANVTSVGMTSPKAMAVTQEGVLLVVGNGLRGDTIQRFDAVTGAALGSLVAPGAGGLAAGQGILLAQGMAWVSDGADHAVRRYDLATGAFVDVFVAPGAGGLLNPHALDLAPDGGLVVASRSTDSVKRYDGATGAFTGDLVAPQAGGLLQPAGVLFVDAACPTDLDDDGATAFGDLLALLAEFGPCPVGGACPGDLDGDGAVAFGDLLMLLAAWGPCE